jgi:hypothetical protein
MAQRSRIATLRGWKSVVAIVVVLRLELEWSFRMKMCADLGSFAG